MKFLNNKSISRLILPCLLLCLQLSAQVPEEEKPELRPIDPKTKTIIIDSVFQVLGKYYVFPKSVKKMEKHIRKRLKKGAYENNKNLAEFSEALSDDLREISLDLHLRLFPYFAPKEVRQPESPEKMRERWFEERKYWNFGFKKLEILAGNVGYLELRSFDDVTYAGPAAESVMAYLANTNALIIDLRTNPGGHPNMIQLLSSYFFNQARHLVNYHIPAHDSTIQYWSHHWVSGKRLIHQPIYILTSKGTFSGAEEFSYNLQQMKRATVVGEPSAGGAHLIYRHVFKNLNISLSLPYSRALNPVSGSNWEGTGVTPDIKVTVDNALEIAHLTALDSLLNREKDPRAKSIYSWEFKGLKAKYNPVEMTADQLKAFVGDYGPRKIWLDGNNLYYTRTTRPALKLIPMGKDMFMMKEYDAFRIKFIRNGSGQVVELQGIYIDGKSDRHKKSS